MTISDAQTKRDKLENDILALLRTFEEETQLTIQKIELQHAKPMGMQRAFVVAVAVPIGF